MASRSPLRALVAIALGCLALSACRVDTVVSLNVEPDGSGVLAVVATADAEVMASAPNLVNDLNFDDAKSAGWKVSDIETLETDDELYLCEYHDRDSLQPLLHTEWQGDAVGFVEHDWTDCDPKHLVMYLRPLGSGCVLYNTLGHCRGHYDMAPVLEYYPRIERCSWENPAYHELLRRSLRWARGDQ